MTSLLLSDTEVRLRNHVQVFGDGPRTMVFAHGLGCDQTTFQHLAPAFARDFRVVLFDYCGSGQSLAAAYDEQRYSSLHGYKQDLLDVLGALDLHDVVFVGHSVSSMIGAMASIEQPGRFSDIVMVAPSPRYLNDAPGGYRGGFEPAEVAALLNMMEHNYTGWAYHMAPVAMKNEARPQLADELARQYCSMDPYIARRFAEVTFNSDARQILPFIETPTLILQCTDDAIAAIEVGEYLAARMPHATLKVMNATGHCPQLSQPEETIALIREYVAMRVAS